jgi:Na+-driven multidrug efflux pump
MNEPIVQTHQSELLALIPVWSGEWSIGAALESRAGAIRDRRGPAVLFQHCGYRVPSSALLAAGSTVTLVAAATGAALCGAASCFDVGIVRVWVALATMNVVRIATLRWRFRRGRWAVVAADGARA